MNDWLDDLPPNELRAHVDTLPRADVVTSTWPISLGPRTWGTADPRWVPAS